MEATLLAPGQGETISDSPERLVRILADEPQIALTDNRYAHGESGPGAHIHREHADCFYVTSGELTFDLGPEATSVPAPAGTFVLVPPNVIHTFRNEAEPDAHFLNIHAPNKGFADHLRSGSDAAGDDFDTFDPPDDGGAPAESAVITGPDHGEAIELGPTRALIKAGGGEGIGSVTLMESSYAPGFEGPPPHRHNEMVDSFFVLDGSLTLLLGTETAEAGPGTYAVVPPKTRHTFSNPRGETVRALNIMAPGGFEAYLREMTALMRDADGQPDPSELARVASAYDFELAVD